MNQTLAPSEDVTNFGELRKFVVVCLVCLMFIAYFILVTCTIIVCITHHIPQCSYSDCIASAWFMDISLASDIWSLQETLRNNIISAVKQSAALNRPGAENMIPRQLCDAIHDEIRLVSTSAMLLLH